MKDMDNDKLILIIIIIGLLFLMWDMGRPIRSRTPCEDMTREECEAYMEVMGSR